MTNLHPGFRWSSASVTDAGRVRQVNEDACLERPDIGLWAVADGVGGHEAGDLASRTVVQALDSTPVPLFMGQAVADLRRRLLEANHRLRSEADRRGQGIIGSTVALLVALHDHCTFLWVGDSRVYRLRGRALQRLSRDHSQVEDLIDQGLLDRRAAENHPAANVITRAVGAAEVLEIDAQTLQIKDGDCFLLCTDGLTKEVSEREIAAALSGSDVVDAVPALIDLACDRGARDNVTAVAIRFSAEGTRTPGG
ncbi:MAG: protein phosphatase 2C domain-containing protein [Pseudomonadota bacterium]|nr:protein phosphatase 2C domain-containing protein [Pseudomonadota bacterium]